MDLINIPTKPTPREDISLNEIRKAKKVEVKHYEVEQKEVSKNIQRFDKKPRVYTENPYSYNAISLGKYKTVKMVPSAEQMVATPVYNAVGKVLGLDAAKEWNQFYDKVFEITEWAKKKTKSEDINVLIKFISDKSRTIPSLGARRIDDIFIHSKLSK